MAGIFPSECCSLPMGAQVGRLFFLRIFNQDENSDLPKRHTSYLKEITSLSVGSLAKKNFKAG